MHFTHNDDVRVFTQGSLQSGVVRDGVFADLTLGHGTLFGKLQYLNRFFNCDDVILTLFVGNIHHGGKGGGLTGTDGTGHKNKTVVVVKEFPDGGGIPFHEAQLFKLADVIGDQTVAA